MRHLLNYKYEIFPTKLQQALAPKQGPRRKRTEAELQEARACSHALRGNRRGAMFRVVNE